MAHDMFFAKLCQLDDGLQQMHRRVSLSESASHAQLRQEIEALELECSRAESALRQNLRQSRAALAPVLSQSCRQIDQILQATAARLQEMEAKAPDREAAVEEKLLLAEYALDFAQNAVNRALLISMDAIDASLLCRQERNTP